MMNNRAYFLILLFCLLPWLGFTQKLPKPQVIVYGEGIDAWAAAMQAAKSNIPTLWIHPQADGKVQLAGLQGEWQMRHDIDGGLWADLLAVSIKATQITDSVLIKARQEFQVEKLQDAALQMTNGQKMLSILRGQQIKKVRKQGKQWSVETNLGQRYKVRALVDASADHILFKQAGVEVFPPRLADDQWPDADPVLGLRTSIGAVMLQQGKPSYLSLGMLISDQETTLYTTRISGTWTQWMPESLEKWPFQALVGQAVGASAAYSAFFKQNSKQVDVRKVQGELLQYQARLIPLQDISLMSPYRKAIERVLLSGILQAEPGPNEQQWYFRGDHPVPSSAISEALNPLYVRNAIWWKDHPSEALTLKQLLDYIKFVSYKGHEIDLQAERLWTQRWKFEDTFAMDLVLNRTQFAVILDHFATPFHTSVNYQGKFLR